MKTETLPAIAFVSKMDIFRAGDFASPTLFDIVKMSTPVAMPAFRRIFASPQRAAAPRRAASASPAEAAGGPLMLLTPPGMENGGCSASATLRTAPTVLSRSGRRSNNAWAFSVE